MSTTASTTRCVLPKTPIGLILPRGEEAAEVAAVVGPVLLEPVIDDHGPQSLTVLLAPPKRLALAPVPKSLDFPDTEPLVGVKPAGLQDISQLFFQKQTVDPRFRFNTPLVAVTPDGPITFQVTPHHGRAVP